MERDADEMTKKLYYDSAYLTEWQTTISNVVETANGVFLELEETAFYPEGGGQPCDSGTIGEMNVLDVAIEGETILHKVDNSSLAALGMTVTCRLNWDRRFDHMQQHSGQHLLSAVCLQKLEAPTLSFHLGEDYATIDIELDELSGEKLDMLEQEVNRHIYLNHAISSYFVTAEEAARLPLVKQPKVTSGIRIVETKDVEYNACGGTHVSSTGEIGMIKLLKSERQKGNIRIYFLCGARALNEFKENQRILSALALKFNTGKDEILSRFEKWEQEHKQLQLELSLQKEKNDGYLLKELVSSSTNGVIACEFVDRSLKDTQQLAVKLAAATELPVLLLAVAESKVVLAYGRNDGFACGAFFKEHLTAYKGKGGGNDKLAQAGFGSNEEARVFFDFARQALSERELTK